MKRRAFLGGFLAAALWPRGARVAAPVVVPPPVPPAPVPGAPLTFGGIPIVPDAQCPPSLVYIVRRDGWPDGLMLIDNVD